MENKMAKLRREDKPSPAARNTVRGISESVAEQTRRIEETGAEVGQNLTQMGADLLRQNADMLRNALRVGPDLATAFIDRSTEQLGRALGLSGSEAEQTTERSARGAATILHSTSALANSANGISQEYFAFVRQRIQSGMNRMSELQRCRSPQEVAALQIDFLRETMESGLQTGRRMAELSLKVLADADKQIQQETERRVA